MNDGTDELRELYREASAQEAPSRADRLAVRMSIAAATVGAVQATATAASAATAGMQTGQGAILAKGAAIASTSSGTIASTAIPATAAIASIGTQSVVHGLFGGKFLSAVLLGATLGTTVTVAPQLVPLVLHPTPTRVEQQARDVNRSAPHRVPSPLAQRATLPVAAPTDAQSAAPVNLANGPIEADPQQPASDLVETPRKAHEALASAAPAVTASLSRATTSIPLSTRNAGHLMRETAELAKVQAALTSANPEAAIALLDSQDQLFRGGQLAEERDAARVLALCAASRVSEASRARVRFEALHPMSPLLARVQRSCAK